MAPSFSPLDLHDLEGIRVLVAMCVDHDGGLPDSSDADFVRRSFLAGPSIGMRASDGSLVAAAALGEPSNGVVPASGVVHPSCRGRGIGKSLVEWALSTAGDDLVQLRSESMTEEFEDLAAQFGFARVFCEHVMRRSTTPALDAHLDNGIVLRPWTDDTAHGFFEAYSASFADRPGFPGWTEPQWAENWTSDGDFRPDASLVAIDASGLPIGFVLIGAHWIEQIGVVPAWRRKGIARALLGHAVDSIAATGSEEVWLNVNENNASAMSLYEGVGFSHFGRRGRFERATSA
jgi:mycothiol synthase